MEKAKTGAGIAVVATAIILLLYGVVVCPPGVIDESVIKAAGACFCFSASVLGVELKWGK